MWGFVDLEGLAIFRGYACVEQEGQLTIFWSVKYHCQGLCVVFVAGTFGRFNITITIFSGTMVGPAKCVVHFCFVFWMGRGVFKQNIFGLAGVGYCGFIGPCFFGVLAFYVGKCGRFTVVVGGRFEQRFGNCNGLFTILQRVWGHRIDGVGSIGYAGHCYNFRGVLRLQVVCGALSYCLLFFAINGTSARGLVFMFGSRGLIVVGVNGVGTFGVGLATIAGARHLVLYSQGHPWVQGYNFFVWCVTFGVFVNCFVGQGYDLGVGTYYRGAPWFAGYYATTRVIPGVAYGQPSVDAL